MACTHPERQNCNGCTECSASFLQRLFAAALHPNTKVSAETVAFTVLGSNPEDVKVAIVRTRIKEDPDFSIKSLLDNLGSR